MERKGECWSKYLSLYVEIWSAVTRAALCVGRGTVFPPRHTRRSLNLSSHEKHPFHFHTFQGVGKQPEIKWKPIVRQTVVNKGDFDVFTPVSDVVPLLPHLSRCGHNGLGGGSSFPHTFASKKHGERSHRVRVRERVRRRQGRQNDGDGMF
jgi:hypothetical protein